MNYLDYLNALNYLNYSYRHDVAEKVGTIGAIGAIAAALAMFALLSGVAKIQRKSVPKEFPSDPEALQAKYLLAFRQLENASNDSPEGVKGLLAALKTNPAAYMAIEAFGKYQSKNLSKNLSKNQNKNQSNSQNTPTLPPEKGGKS